jgi:hypothetical protein
MRAKIPQLREALAGRFEIEHHGVMVAQLLAPSEPSRELMDRRSTTSGKAASRGVHAIER